MAVGLELCQEDEEPLDAGRGVNLVLLKDLGVGGGCLHGSSHVQGILKLQWDS